MRGVFVAAGGSRRSFSCAVSCKWPPPPRQARVSRMVEYRGRRLWCAAPFHQCYPGRSHSRPMAPISLLGQGRYTP